MASSPSPSIVVVGSGLAGFGDTQVGALIALSRNPALSAHAGLAAKLAVCVIASTAAFFALFGFINLRMERTHSEELIKQSAYRVADVILRSTHYEMLHNDREALYNVIRELGSEGASRCSSKYLSFCVFVGEVLTSARNCSSTKVRSGR